MKRLFLSIMLALCAGYITTAHTPAFAKAAKDATPADCYTSWNTALYYAKDLKGLISYFPRAHQSNLRNMPADQQVVEFKKYKGYYISGARLLDQKVNGDKAHVRYSGVGLTGTKAFNATVDADLVREDKYWKIGVVTISGQVQL